MAVVEPTQLFFAYAHRTDNYWASRYLLTFASADVCKEWWELVQSEYPNQAIRLGSQLFSFQGDNFPSKPATSKKFGHLKTKWFYCQFGDATGTDGRHQDIIPLQDSNGNVIGGAGSGGGGKADDGEKGEAATRQSGIDFGALAESLQSAKGIADQNNAQIARLADQEAKSQERIERMEKLIEGNAKQLQTLTDSHIKSQQQNKELLDENAKILRELQNQPAEQKNPPAPTQANGNINNDNAQAPIQPTPQSPWSVHPPPRKIDKQLVGFAYKNDPPKRVNGVKRPETNRFSIR